MDRLQETQQEADLATDQREQAVTVTVKDTTKPTWPKDLSKQITTVRDMLAQMPQATDSLASQFKRRPSKSVRKVLDALDALGQVNSMH